MAEKIRAGFVGLGKIAQTQYLPALIRDGRAEPVALCDISESLAYKSAAAFNLPGDLAVSSLDELLRRKPQVVFVLTHDHESIARRLIDEGISVCVEKPLCWSAERAAELVQYASDRGVKLYACYMKRFDPTFEAFAEHLRTADSILSADVLCYAGNNKKWCDPLFSIQKESADEKAAAKRLLGKAWDDFYAARPEQRPESQLLLQLGIHQINLLHVLLGDFTVEACVRRKRGGVLSISAIFDARGTAVNYSLVPLFDAPWDWRESYTAVCRDKLLRYEPGCPFLSVSVARLRIFDDTFGLGFSEYKAGYGNPFARMVHAILDALEGDGPADERLSPDQAVRDLHTVETMLRNCRS